MRSRFRSSNKISVDRMSIRLILILTAFLWVALPGTASAQDNAALSFDEIITALNAKLPNRYFKDKPMVVDYVIKQIRQRLIDDTFTPDWEKRLRAQGANDELISVAREYSAKAYPLLSVDPSSGSLAAAFYLSSRFGFCSKLVSLEGIVESFDSDGELVLSVGGKNLRVYFVQSDLPEEFREALQLSLFRKGTPLRVWVHYCGSGGFANLAHVVHGNYAKLFNRLPSDPSPGAVEDIGLGRLRLAEIDRLLESAYSDAISEFYSEFAPGVPVGPRSEFETTAEYNSRIARLAQLKHQQRAGFIRIVLSHTGKLVEERLQLTTRRYVRRVAASLQSYDADAQMYDVRVEGCDETLSLEIAPVSARSLKSNFDDAVLFQDLYLIELDGSWELGSGRIWLYFEDQRFLVRGYGLCDVTLAPTSAPSKKQVDDSPTSAPSKIISGGVVNGKAINLVKPPYPAAARAVRASGAVNVQVTIDEKGSVISAVAVSGHPLLRAAAVEAARASTFSPTLLMGVPVKVEGVLVYNFQP